MMARMSSGGSLSKGKRHLDGGRGNVAPGLGLVAMVDG
jgi:hypothetical protein